MNEITLWNRRQWYLFNSTYWKVLMSESVKASTFYTTTLPSVPNLTNNLMSIAIRPQVGECQVSEWQSQVCSSKLTSGCQISDHSVREAWVDLRVNLWQCCCTRQYGFVSFKYQLSPTYYWYFARGLCKSHEKNGGDMSILSFIDMNFYKSGMNETFQL